MIASSLAGHFLNTLDSKFFDTWGKKGNIEFFLFVTIVGWLISIACPIFFIPGVHEKFPAVPWTLVVSNFQKPHSKFMTKVVHDQCIKKS